MRSLSRLRPRPGRVRRSGRAARAASHAVRRGPLSRPRGSAGRRGASSACLHRCSGRTSAPAEASGPAYAASSARTRGRACPNLKQAPTRGVRRGGNRRAWPPWLCAREDGRPTPDDDASEQRSHDGSTAESGRTVGDRIRANSSTLHTPPRTRRRRRRVQVMIQQLRTTKHRGQGESAPRKDPLRRAFPSQRHGLQELAGTAPGVVFMIVANRCENWSMARS